MMRGKTYKEGQLLVSNFPEDQERVVQFLKLNQLTIINPVGRNFLLVQVPVGQEHNWIDKFAEVNLIASLDMIRKAL